MKIIESILNKLGYFKQQVKDVKSVHGDIYINGDVTGNVKSTHGDIKIKGSVSGYVESVHGNVEKGFTKTNK